MNCPAKRSEELFYQCIADHYEGFVQIHEDDMNGNMNSEKWLKSFTSISSKTVPKMSA